MRLSISFQQIQWSIIVTIQILYMTKSNRHLISVIVPIYNVEPYIERCAISLFEQTLEDIEYIFVNDCTPDNSMEVLKKIITQYPDRQQQIRIINLPENKGAAYAREVGIKAATGEYVIHCDSDDWIDTDMYRLLYEKAECGKHDIVICDWYETDGVQHIHRKQDLDKRPDIMQGLINRSISGSLCNKLISTALYKEIVDFPKAHMMEDVFYSIQLFAKNKKEIVYIPKALYYYYNNNLSICNHPSKESCLQRCEQACTNIDDIINFLKNNNLEEKFRHELVVLKNSARVFIWPLYIHSPKDYREKWRSVYPEINWRYPFTPGISSNLRIIFLLANIGIYPYILRIIRKLRNHKNEVE